MNDSYAPLSGVIVRALLDKGYDKRKNAAIEIERIVKEFAIKDDSEQIKNVISVLQKFVLAPNAQSRKGGLIGLASVAMGLGSKVIDPYLTELARPMFPCFKDNTPHVRYYATESLYNVCRVARGAILHLFHDIFSIIIDLSMETDQNVKSGAELLDKVLKEIVTESPEFDLVSFIPLLSEKLIIDHISTQMIMISWVSVLQSIPDVDLVPFLPDIVDGLFFILKSPKKEVKTLTEGVLGELMVNIKKKPTNVKYTQMINILTTHAQSEDALVQKMALTMILTFLRQSKKAMMPYSSGILCAAITCITVDDPGLAATRSLADEVSNSLMELITSEDDVVNKQEDTLVADKLDLPAVMLVLQSELPRSPVSRQTTVLRWLYHLIDKVPQKMEHYVNDLFHLLLKTVCDPSDEVVLLALEVLAQISSSNFQDSDQRHKDSNKSTENLQISKERLMTGTYFKRFLQSLLRLFECNYDILKLKISFIVRQLCVMLSSEDIYRTFADLLLKEKNLHFAKVMVQTLSSILLTSKELFPLRCRLKELNSEESCDLFVCLYRCWCHSPVATLTLCLLTKSYSHAVTLIHAFGDLDLTTDTLVELDKLVQMLESPIFSFLRLQLLCPAENIALVQTLYGILMLLPQTEAFQILRCRLNCVPPAHLTGDTRQISHSPSKWIDYSVLLTCFHETQQKHKQYNEDELRTRLKSSMITTASN